jgi:hypothetical protein
LIFHGTRAIFSKVRRYLHVYSAVDPGSGLTYFREFDDGTAGGQSWWIGMTPLSEFIARTTQGFLVTQTLSLAAIINGDIGYQIVPYAATFDAQTPGQSGTHGNPDYSGYRLAREQAGKAKESKITGVWIIARLGLYFAGFEAGTGDPIFVRFVLGGATSAAAHLYLTQAQADLDAARIRKIYKRPDIPVDVIQI